MRATWWQDFFDKTTGDFMFGRIPASRTRREVATVLKASRVGPGSRILDLACGRGRHSIEFASKGFFVTGLDFSKRYIDEAAVAAKARRLKGRADFVRGDMRRLAPHFSTEHFDLVTSLFNSFGYFSNQRDDGRVLSEVRRVLRPGGLLVLNTANHLGVEQRILDVPKAAGLDHLDRWEFLGKGRYLLDRARYDSSRRKIHVEWHFLDVQRRREKKYEFQQSVYSPQQLDALLKSNGFLVLKRWGPLEGGSFKSISWHQTVLAKKVR